MEKQKNKIPKWLKIILIVLAIIILASIFSSSEETDNSESPKKETEHPTEKFSVVENSEKGYADDYGFAYYIEGTIKNNTSKKYTYVQVSYNVYDSEGNNLGTCLANNNNLGANETWKFKAICSGEANNITSYKLAEITGY